VPSRREPVTGAAQLKPKIAVGTPITEHRPQSGRIEGRNGLGMMPTFPRSPLSFRTAGFPRYGWKAGMSGGAFPSITRLSLLPAFTGQYCLRPPFVHLVVGFGDPAQCRAEDSIVHRLGGWVALRPSRLLKNWAARLTLEHESDSCAVERAAGGIDARFGYADG
jgi:hypothetical protein